jgi:hypothetical protein
MTEEDETFIKKALGTANTFKWLTPTNLKEEKRKFFKSETYDPQFTYKQIPEKKVAAAQKNLKKLKSQNGNGLKSYITKRRIKEAKLKLGLIASIGDAKAITLLSEKLYGLKFKKSYLKQAIIDASIDLDFTKKEILSAKQTAQIIKKYLNKYSQSKWKVMTTTKNDFYIQVRFKKNLIKISESINWDFTDIDSTLAHEIDGHVVRAINAASQQDTRFCETFPFYIKTEEGLASFLGDYCSPNGKISLKHHAIKYLAGYFALNNSFRETYKLFQDYGFSRELAFQRTLRLKKGLTDTSLPGCNAREAMYYEGMLEVKNFIDKGGDMYKLFSAKAGLEDIKYLPLPKHIIIPKRLENYPRTH